MLLSLSLQNWMSFCQKAYNSDKSYTCKLQQALYKDRNYSADINNATFVAYYNSLMRSGSIL